MNYPGVSTLSYVDVLGVEGAHSCISYTTTSWTSSVSQGNDFCQRLPMTSAAHLLTSQQTALIGQTSVNGVFNGALSAASALAIGSICPSRSPREFGVGASTPSLSNTPTNWVWTDGTNASNINCGSNGCGQWWSTYPR